MMSFEFHMCSQKEFRQAVITAVRIPAMVNFRNLHLRGATLQPFLASFHEETKSTSKNQQFNTYMKCAHIKISTLLIPQPGYYIILQPVF